RVEDVTAKARKVPALTYPIEGGMVAKSTCTRPPTCTGDRLGGEIAAGPRPGLDDELLAKPLRQPLRHQTREDVICAASGKADDDAHRPRGIGFRASKAGCGWQSSRSCDEMKELATIDRQDACPKNRARRLRVPRQHDSIRLTPA